MDCFEWNKNNVIDFESIEEKLGYKIHSDLKEFYKKNDIPDCRFRIDKNNINCLFKGINWFGDSNNIFITFEKIDGDYENKIINNFNQEWIYGYDEVNETTRYILGYLQDERGRMGLYFNNDTGAVEFCDYEYGADSWSENPRGIISDSIKNLTMLLTIEVIDDNEE